jgi:dipeptidyl aminopeptidase/acylaminoacyl peptidase
MARRPIDFDDLYRLPVAADPQLSPDGTDVVYVVTMADREADENRSALWLAAADGASPARKITNGPADSAPRWTPDAGSILFLRKPSQGGAEARPQVFRLPRNGGEPVQLTALDGGVSSFAVSPDGNTLAVTSSVDLDPPDQPKTAPVVTDRLGYKADGAGLLKGRRPHLFVVGIEPGSEARQLTEGDKSISGPAWSPDGTRIAFATADHPDRDLNPGSALHVIDAHTPDAKADRLTPELGNAAGVLWLDDERLLYAGKANSAPGHARLLTIGVGVGVGVGVGEPAELAPGFDRNVMLGAPAYPGSLPRRAGDDIVFCARDRGCTHVYRVPVTGGAPEKIVGAADTTASNVTVDRSGARLAILTSTPTSPGDVVVRSVVGGEVTALTDHALGDVDLAVPEARVFTAPDGTEVHGWVLRARSTTTDAAKPGPLLLDVHGGPHNAWNPAFDGIHLYHQVLAAQGWTILFVNPRGSDGYGEDFYTAVVEGWGTADLDDFTTPIDVLVDDGIADPARLAVTGYSYGGFMTCWLTSRTDRFAAAVAGGSVTNHVSLFGSSDAGHYLAAIEIGGLPGDDAKRLHEHSPMTYVGDVTAPTLILDGENDDRCPIEQAEQWFAGLRSQGVPTRFVRYPGASHLFIAMGRPSHRLDYNRRVVEWLNEHVPVS